ncbi:MAG: CRISPR-associated endonuclease Cas1 [Bacteroides sp.]|nr:CRISPR-associated endonuclease Cas1 [Bacteroides sp.]MCM1548736.1 CRISPR-associated endonuclease Cas1 [Clostridium sp.]
MSYLYVTEHGATISVSANYVKVQYRDDKCREIPIETLESISIFSKAQMTTQCTVECLKRGIPVAYYSKVGNYFGRLESTGHIHVERQRKQAELYNTEFALELGKRILYAKVKNQEVVLHRYARNQDCNIVEEVKMMHIACNKLAGCESIEQLMGYEGTAARYYFQGLSKLVDERFQFSGRSKRPPKDEFNAMLSLGYSILMNEIYGKIQNKGLNPYFGFIHRDKEKHPTLASDLMEEWRAVIVDSVVMSLVNGHEISLEHFQHDLDEPGFFLTNNGMKIFISKLDNKIHTDTKYLNYIEYPVSFRRGIELQIGQLVKAMEEEDVELYHPVRIR